MFEITLQETRVYREAKEEGRQEGLKQALEEIREKGLQQGREEVKRELIPRCLAYGISIEEVAKLLDLTIEQVEQIRLASEQESSTSTL
ncbi:MAG: aspartate aminotransferase [Nostoc sp.]|uniref:aspartate aminotransferase n=1 Tax=Nostoc sp. TaxID=1180 RepID=UPI002FEE9EE4